MISIVTYQKQGRQTGVLTHVPKHIINMNYSCKERILFKIFSSMFMYLICGIFLTFIRGDMNE